MIRESMIKVLRYKAEHIKTRIKPEFFLKVADALEQQSEDAVSRQAVLEYIEGSEADLWHDSENEFVRQDIRELPSIQPKPKTGHWIRVDNLFHKYKCSNCGDIIWTDENHIPYMDSPYCCRCGCRMIDSQESENTET